MKTSKLTVIGLLICLSSLYFMSDVWLANKVLEVIPAILVGVYGFPIGVIITVIGLFKKEKN